MEKEFYVYILASGRNGTMYVGITSKLIQRVWQHRNDLVQGFTRENEVHRLVWFERHESAESAIVREKRIKAWKRGWKLRLVEVTNPYWRDLYPGLIGRIEVTGFRPSPE